jgi:Zn-dependent peptidase ImmA (M78 family)
MVKPMDALTGVTSGLRFLLQWTAPRASGTAAEATRGDLYIEIAARPAWGDRTARSIHGIHWTWVDLLEHLGQHWQAVLWEETDPLGLNVLPHRLRAIAEKRWDHLSGEGVDREQRLTLRFEHSHNLAMALGGASVPALWVIREGANMVMTFESSGDVDSAAREAPARAHTTRRPFPEVKATLEAIGDQIARRLETIADERARLAVERWRQRDSIPASHVVAVATGLPPVVIAALEEAMPPAKVWGFDGSTARQTAMLAAARMLGPQAPTQVISEVLGWIRGCSTRATPDLDALAAQAASSAGTLTGPRAFAQGYGIATWLREIPGVVRKHGKVEPNEILAAMGVHIEERPLGWSGIDAVACWSESHGPAVLLNSSGGHAQGSAGRRTTLAHELCHLLVDRRSSLPVAEVLGGRVPVHAEMRANAFAAELLLPRAVAGAALAAASDVSREVTMMKRHYGVSGEIVAWQALRSDYAIAGKTLMVLRDCVADPRKWDRAVKAR